MIVRSMQSRRSFLTLLEVRAVARELIVGS